MTKRISHHYPSTSPPSRAFLGRSNPTFAQANCDAVSSQSVLRVTSQTLFDGAQELEISHHGARYRLRQTALGKLILTK